MEKQTINSNYFYLLIKLNYQPVINKDTVETIINEMITKCYGSTGMVASDTKVLNFNQKDLTIILRCLKGSLSSVWAAANLFYTYNTHPCILEVIKVSPWLLPLSNPNRFSVPKKSIKEVESKTSKKKNKNKNKNKNNNENNNENNNDNEEDDNNDSGDEMKMME